MPLRLIARVDRRSPNRLPTPPCPRCGHDESMVGTIRTPGLVGFRCMGCGTDLVVATHPPSEVRPRFAASIRREA